MPGLIEGVMPMPGLYVMAVISAVIAFGVIGGLLLLFAPRDYRRTVLLLIALELPMSGVFFLFVRQPIDAGIRTLGLDAGLYGFIASWYAPLTEEPAKLLPLILPFFFRQVSRDNAVTTGLALGLGFGLGEIAFLAWLLNHNPQVAALPWYIFTGFLIERILVCFLHGAITAVAVWMWCRGQRWGILVAMVLHYLLNFPIYLSTIAPMGLDRAMWINISLIWTVIMVIGMGGALAFMRGGRQGVKTMLGAERTCPGCGGRYKPTIVGLNLLFKRYEPCPHCKKWHLI